MIKDAKFVKSVTSNAPKKGWKIEWTDGKFDNFFDGTWLPILDEAQRTNRLVATEKEKNQAGYWNIITLELAELPSVESPKESPKIRPQGTNESIESQVAFKGLIELIVADKIQIDGLVGKWALAWAMGKLGAVPEDIQKLAKATKSKGKEE